MGTVRSGAPRCGEEVMSIPLEKLISHPRRSLVCATSKGGYGAYLCPYTASSATGCRAPIPDARRGEVIRALGRLADGELHPLDGPVETIATRAVVLGYRGAAILADIAAIVGG